MGPCQGCAASRCGLGPLGGPIAVILDITYNISQTSQSASPLCPPGAASGPIRHRRCGGCGRAGAGRRGSPGPGTGRSAASANPPGASAPAVPSRSGRPGGCRSRSAPAPLSEITRSMIPRSRASQAVSFSRWAASSALPASFHKMLAQPLGGDHGVHRVLQHPHLVGHRQGQGPPLPPSPMRVVMMGVFRAIMPMRLAAMAWPWPRSSAPMPQ